MHKVMVFIDYQNFFISWKWKNRGRKPPFVDYQKLGRTLHDLGKIVVIAHFPEQNIAKYQGMYDAEVILDDDLLHRAGNASYGREKRSRKRYPSRFPSEKK